MSETLGQAVLELKTDGAKFFADLAAAKTAGKDLGTTFDHTSQSAERAGQQQGKLGDLTSGLGGTFGVVTKIAGAFGVALSFEGAIEGAKRLTEYADTIYNTAMAYGVSMKAVQEYGAAGKSVGIDMETMSNGMFQLSRRIADGDAKATAAVQSLGLNVKQLRTLSPDEIFDKVAAAVKNVANPLTQMKLAQELFGRGASQLMALIKSGLPEAKQFAEQMGLVASDESITRVHNLGEQFGVMLGQVKAGAVDAYADVLRLLHLGNTPPPSGRQGLLRQPGQPGTPIAPDKNQAKQQAEGLLAVAGAFKINADAVRDVAAGAEHAMTDEELLQKRLQALRDEALIPLTAADREHVRVMHEANVGEAEIATTLDKPIGAVSKYVKALDEAAQKEKQHQDALREIARAHVELSDKEKIRIGNLHAMGIGDETIAKATEIAVERVKAETAAEDAWAKGQITAQKEVAAAVLEGDKAQREAAAALTTAQVEAGMSALKVGTDLQDKLSDATKTATDARLAQIDREEQATERQLKVLSILAPWSYGVAHKAATDYYQHERDLANGTASTIEERMRAQGIVTRAELQRTADQAKRDYEAMRDSGEYTADQVGEAWIASLQAQANATGKIGDQLEVDLIKTLKSIPDIVVSALTSGGGLVGAAKGVASAVGSVLGAALGKYIGQKIGEAIGSTLGGAVGSAAGAAIGSAAGSIIDLAIKWQTKAGKDAAKTIGREWGVTISEAMKNQLTEAAHQAGDEVAATFQLMAKVIDDTGGVTKKNLAKWTAALHDAFAVQSWNAHYTADDLQKTFDDVFPKLTEVVTKEGGVWSQQFQDLMTLARRFKLDLESVNAVLNDQVTTIGTGLASQLGPLTTQYGTLGDQIAAQRKVIDDLNKQIGSPEVLQGILEQNAAVTKAQQDVDDLVAAGKSGTDEWRLAVVNLTLAQQGQNQFSKDYQAEVGKLNGLLDTQAAGAQASQASLDRVGQSVLASFNAGIAKGLDQLTLLDELAPALDGLVSIEQNLGVESKNAGVQELIALRAKLTANKELAAAETSWGTTYAAMVNLGVTDSDALLSMQQQGVDNYDKLTAAGLTESQALAQIKGGLQAVYDAHEKMGTPIDENTQKLIDQAKAYGLITDNSQDLGDVFKGVGKDIVDSVNHLSDTIAGRLGPAIETIPGETTSPDGSRRYHVGGRVMDYAGGSYFGHLGRVVTAHAGLALGEVPVIAQTGEDIWSRADVARWGGLANVEALRAGMLPTGPSDSGDVTFEAKVDEEVLVRFIANRFWSRIGNRGVRPPR